MSSTRPPVTKTGDRESGLIIFATDNVSRREISVDTLAQNTGKSVEVPSGRGEVNLAKGNRKERKHGSKKTEESKALPIIQDCDVRIMTPFKITNAVSRCGVGNNVAPEKGVSKDTEIEH